MTVKKTLYEANKIDESGFEIIENEEEDKTDLGILKDLELDELFEKDDVVRKKDVADLLNRKWKGRLMITLLAKIGLDKPNPEYFDFIKDLLQMPQSIGMIGKILYSIKV
jgi:hypothetical protein